MQQTSALYKTLLADPAHIKETRVQIDETWYGESSIVALSTSEPLFSGDTVSFGGAVAREIELSGFFPDSIPRRARITVQVRLALGNQVSEWLPKGVFYIDTRSRNQITGVTTIHGFDAILMGEQEWIPADSDVFPMSMEAAVKKTAAALNLEIDPRTTFKTGDAYMVDHPVAEPELDEETGETDVKTQSGVTIRQLWRWVAAAMGGNFITNDLGQLRLIPLNALPASTAYLVNEDGDPITFGGYRLLVGTPSAAGSTVSGDKVFVGQRATSAEVFPALQPISRIILKVDNDSAYVSGSDTGMTMEVSCPYGSQKIARDLFAQLQGYVYQPMSAEETLIDPAAELGDGVTVNGVYTILAQKDTTFDLFCAADISAPGKPELESEFRFTSQQQAEYNYELAKTRSLISKTAEQIRLEIVGVEEEMSYIQLDLDKITSRVQDAEGNISTLEQTATSLRSDIDGKIDGEAAQTLIDQSLENITFDVSNGETSSTITLKVGEVEIKSPAIQMTGVVTFAGLKDGTTTIDGSCIKTGTIDADRLNLTGQITFGDLDEELQSDIENAGGISEQQAKTLITDTLVSSPTIAGGVFTDLSQEYFLEMNTDADSGEYGFRLRYTYTPGKFVESDTVYIQDLFAVSYDGYGRIEMHGPYGMILGVDNDKTVYPVGSWDFSEADSVDFGGQSADDLGITFDVPDLTPSGDLYLEGRGISLVLGKAGGTAPHIWAGGNIFPNAASKYNCGGTNFPWAGVYSDTCSACTSDRHKKKDITYGLDHMDGFFDNLMPSEYRLVNGTSGRKHNGFVAQDIKANLDKHNIPTKDFAGYIAETDEKGNTTYALRYSEFIPLLVDQVQKLKARVAQLEGGVKA